MPKRIAGNGLIAIAIVAAHAALAGAQHYQPFGDIDVYHDVQLFAPPIVDEYGDEPVPPNYGWYIEYNRVYLNLTRPENIPSHYQGDFTWGNRIDVGYMTEENDGWGSTIWHINQTSAAERTDVTDIQGNDFTLVNSLNFGEYSGFELNKVFRTCVGQHGAYFESFGGVRWGKFEENVQIETLVVDNPLNPTQEVGTSTVTRIENNMLGGQLGCRTFIRRGHWMLSSAVRGFAMNNWQYFDGSQRQIITVSDGAGGFIVTNPIVTNINESFDEFVFGGELRVDAAYEVTREVRVRVGGELMYFGRGLARGIDANTLSGQGLNDQDAVYAGVVFGVEVNR